MRFFDIHCVAKYRNKRSGDPLVESEKVQKSRRIVPAEKNPSEKHQRGGRGSGVSSMFWTSVVKVDDVEQMNKKVDRSR